LEQLLGKEWEITPAGGATGDAYLAEYEGRKLFLKRNSSPFLAVLSAEGIVPKLVWTKRMENGDVVTAQQWLNARELKPHDMVSEQVANLLRKIHHSKELLAMMKRLGKTPLLPTMMIDDLKCSITVDVLRAYPIVQQALKLLEEALPSVNYEDFVVCHCDINHNNWLLTEDEQLYLIDWDGAMIADPAIDIGMLLYSYIPRDQWKKWLEIYGLDLTDCLEIRMKWYVIAQVLFSFLWHKQKGDKKEMQRSLHFLEQVITQG